MTVFPVVTGFLYRLRTQTIIRQKVYWQETEKRKKKNSIANTHRKRHTRTHKHRHWHTDTFTLVLLLFVVLAITWSIAGIACRACHLSGTFFHCDTLACSQKHYLSTVIAEIFVRNLISYISCFWLKVQNFVWTLYQCMWHRPRSTKI